MGAMAWVGTVLLLVPVFAGCAPPSPEETCDKLKELSKQEKDDDFEFDRKKCVAKMEEMKSRDPDAYKCAAKTVKSLKEWDLAIVAVSVCDPKGKDKDDDEKDKDKDKDKDKKSKSTGDASPAKDEKRFTSAAGRFSAVFPEPPTEKTEPINGVNWSSAGVSAPKGVYNVSYADFATPAAATAARDKFLAGFKGDPNLLEEKDVTVDGQAGKSVSMKISDRVTMTINTVVIDKRFYKVAATKIGTSDAGPTFLSSVKLTK